MGGHFDYCTDIFFFLFCCVRFSNRMKVLHSNIFPLFSDQRINELFGSAINAKTQKQQRENLYRNFW